VEIGSEGQQLELSIGTSLIAYTAVKIAQRLTMLSCLSLAWLLECMISGDLLSTQVFSDLTPRCRAISSNLFISNR